MSSLADRGVREAGAPTVSQVSPSFSVLTVGCSKNLANQARLHDVMLAGGSVAYGGEGKPDVLIVNSCSFTAQARAETMRALDPRRGSLPEPSRIVLVGCMAADERHSAASLQVDASIGFSEYMDIAEHCHTILESPKRPSPRLEIGQGAGTDSRGLPNVP